MLLVRKKCRELNHYNMVKHQGEVLSLGVEDTCLYELDTIFTRVTNSCHHVFKIQRLTNLGNLKLSNYYVPKRGYI